MVKNLSFAALIPERDTFTDIDDKIYEVRCKVDFGAREMARASKLQTQLPNLLRRLKKQPDDEHAAELMEKAIEQLVLMVIPDLPQERLDAMTLGQKQAILDWWNEQQRARTEERKNPQADQAES